MRGGFGGGHGPGFGGGGPAGNKRYNITISAFARNLFNNVNLGSPNANLLSGNFGAYTSLSGFGFGRGGQSPSNRRVDLQVQFSF